MNTLVAFDLDGTLIDSRRDLADSANALIAELGGTPLPVDAITAMVGEGAALLVRRALSASGLAADPDLALQRFLELYDERLLVHTRLYPGTAAMLEATAAGGPISILTNKPQHHTDRLLGALGLAGRFQAVFGGDTRWGRKPDPAGLRELMSKAGAEAAQTVLVGDSAIDLRTARAAGVSICLVRYGFGFSGAVPELRGDELLADRACDIPALLAAR